MSRVWTLSGNTFREVIRDRVLYGLIVFAAFMLLLSLVFGQLSFAEQLRITVNMGLTSIHLCGCVFAIFVGGQVVFKEIERQTILTILSHPVSRAEFIFGKFLGFSIVLLTLLGGLSLIWVGLLVGLDAELSKDIFFALYGIFLEVEVLLALTLFFGCWSRPFLTVLFAISFFLIGHWLPSLEFFAAKSESYLFKFFYQVTTYTLPNFETLNWRSYPLIEKSVDPQWVLMGSGYSLLWIAFLLSAAILVLWRKDFV